MANNNVQNVKFLRNGALFSTREEATTALQEFQLTYEKDGSAILARYGSNNNVKTLVGWVYADNNSHKSITIFDTESSGADVDEKIAQINAKLGNGVTSANTATAQFAALSGTAQDTSAATSVAGAKAYAKDYTDEQINELEYTGVTIGDAVVITNVTETDGKVSAATANVGALKLTDYTKGSDSGSVAASDSINAAIAKLENQIDAANNNVDAKIGALDGTITADTGYYINKVDEVDGKISGTTVALPTIAAISEAGKPITAVSESLGEISAATGAINAEYVNVTGSVFSSTTVQGALEEIETEYKAADTAIVGGASESADTLGKLEGIVNGISADAKEYHIVKTTEDLPAEIKERYSLVDADGHVSGDTIDIPKDSHIVSIDYIDDPADPNYQKLEYVYVNDSGVTSTTYVDMSSLVLEAEFASGVTVTNHVAHGVVDPTSETFLTVGAGGFKLSGVQDAINTAISGLDATVSGETVDGKVNVKVTEADGVITAVDVVGTDIASASALTSEIAARKAVDGVNGDAYTADTNAHYISGASSLYGADQALDAALNTVDNAMLTSVAAGNGVEVTTKENKSQTISAKVNGDGGIVNDSDGLHLGTIDCGTY